jgi:hypothetical protein
MSSPTSQSDRQRKIWLYFLDPRLRYAFVPLLLGLALVEIFLGKFFLLIGFAWLGAALLLDRARPSDQELEELLAADVQPLVEKALQSLDPQDDEMQAPPLVLRGPIELAAPAFRQFLTRPRAGKDGNRRSPVNRLVVLLPLENHLGLYSCQRDSLNDQTTQVSIESHHYRDVVWLALEKDVESAAGQAATGTGQIFSLELKNGRRLSVRVAAGPPRDEATDDHGALSSMEKTVRAIQVLMRDRK